MVVAWIYVSGLRPIRNLQFALDGIVLYNIENDRIRRQRNAVRTSKQTELVEPAGRPGPPGIELRLKRRPETWSPSDNGERLQHERACDALRFRSAFPSTNPARKSYRIERGTGFAFFFSKAPRGPKPW